MIISTGINSIRMGSSIATALYLGDKQVWPTINQNQIIWSNFLNGSCVSLTINSTSNIANSGILWGDASTSGIIAGTQLYRRSFGTGQC